MKKLCILITLAVFTLGSAGLTGCQKKETPTDKDSMDSKQQEDQPAEHPATDKPDADKPMDHPAH